MSIEEFRKMLESARKRDGSMGTETMLVSSHLAQMRLFMLRQGVEFYPKQDTYGFRRRFLAEVILENEVDARLDGIADDFLLDGKGLWYFRPVGESYRMMWFNKDFYRTYYDANGDILEVDLIYSFEVRQGNPGMGVPGQGGNTVQWVRLRVRKDYIEEWICQEKPSFDVNSMMGLHPMGRKRTVRNSLGFIPAVESFNNMRSSGMDATGEFDSLANHILVHNELVRNIRNNLRFYGNPTLVSSRGRQDLLESSDEEPARPTISSQAGFYAAGRPSTRVSMPMGSMGSSGMKVPRLITNIEPNDRVAYITPNAVSGDQNLYARQYREEIRTALGGVDELGISTGATAYEIKSLFGRAATTARRKCRGLLDYGLCKLLALMIHHEERVFRESFAAAIGLKEPAAPQKEEFESPEDYQVAEEAYYAKRGKFEAKLEAEIQKAIENQDIPPGVVGLIPDGDKRVEWRWTGPVFEESTEDILNSSIVVRNLQELGVNSIDALRVLYPSKTDEERAAMLNGYPFRMAQATQSSIGTFLSLISQMRQTPHPQAPDLPLLADPRLDLTPYLYRAFEFLKRELTYAGQYSDAPGTGDPAELDAIERARLNAGLPIDAGTAPTFVPDPGAGGTALPGTSFAADGSFGQRGLQGSVPGAPVEFERQQPLPVSGSILSADPTGTGLPGVAGFGTGLPSSGLRYGDPDFAVPTNAGLPFAGADDGSGSGPAKQRRVSGRGKQRKS